MARSLPMAVLQALSDEPRGVVCDLSAIDAPTRFDPAPLVAAIGGHARDWPGIPLWVVTPDRGLRIGVHREPLAEHLRITGTLGPALDEAAASPPPMGARLQLAPHPVAARAARDFTTRTLLDWRLGRSIGASCLVVSELVTSAVVRSRTPLELSLARCGGRLRLAVRDTTVLPAQRTDDRIALPGTALLLVRGFSSASGTLPVAGGGRVTWAVLDA